MGQVGRMPAPLGLSVSTCQGEGMPREQRGRGSQAAGSRHPGSASHCVALSKLLCLSEPSFLTDWMDLMITRHSTQGIREYHWDLPCQALSPVSGQKRWVPLLLLCYFPRNLGSCQISSFNDGNFQHSSVLKSLGLDDRGPGMLPRPCQRPAV